MAGLLQRSYDDNDKKLNFYLQNLKNYLVTDYHLNDKTNLKNINLLPLKVKNEALKEMSEYELIKVLEGLSNKSIRKLTIEKIRKIKKLESK